jgi:hypothetical protein
MISHSSGYMSIKFSLIQEKNKRNFQANNWQMDYSTHLFFGYDKKQNNHYLEGKMTLY